MENKVNKIDTKLYILSGFLGSGKTTLLIKLIEKLKGKKIGVIQNEFGKLGIDGEVLKDKDIEMVEITRGSIFCTCRSENFVEALAELTKSNFDYLFVESSGIGDPSNVLEILDLAYDVSGKNYDFRGVICLVDAVNFFLQFGDIEAIERQIKHCNLVIITKTDLVKEEKLIKLEEKIRCINPICKIQKSSNGITSYDFLEENLSILKNSESEESTNSAQTKPKTLSMEFTGEIEEDKFLKFIDIVKVDAFRIKGFFNIKGRGICKVDAVGDLVEITETKESYESHLVFISKTGPQIIRTITNSWKEIVNLDMKLKN